MLIPIMLAQHGRTLERDYKSQVLLHSSKMSSSTSLHLKLHRNLFHEYHMRPHYCMRRSSTYIRVFIHNNIARAFLCCIYILICFLLYSTHFPLLFIPTREFSYRTTPAHVLYDQIRVWCCRKSHEIQVAIIAAVQSMRKVKPLAIHWHCVLNVSKMFRAFNWISRADH